MSEASYREAYRLWMMADRQLSLVRDFVLDAENTRNEYWAKLEVEAQTLSADEKERISAEQFGVKGGPQ